MYNPFPLLTPTMLSDQIAKGRRFFVRQNFPRGYDTRLKAAFLLRGYDPIDQPTAQQHLAMLTQQHPPFPHQSPALTGLGPALAPNPSEGRRPDPYAFLYDATIPDHLARLRTAATQPFGYKIFYAAKRGVDWKPPEAYREKMRHYINRNHPDWRGIRSREPVEIGLYEEFGELFLKFSHKDQHDTIPFDLIETY